MCCVPLPSEIPKSKLRINSRHSLKPGIASGIVPGRGAYGKKTRQEAGTFAAISAGRLGCGSEFDLVGDTLARNSLRPRARPSRCRIGATDNVRIFFL